MSEETTYDLPARIELPFEVPEPVPSKLWTDAEVVESVSRADQEEIVSLVEALRSAITEGRAEDAYRLCEFRFEDETRANGFDLEKLRRSVTLGYAKVAAAGVAASPRLTPAEARFRVVGSGRLVLVSRGPFDPAVVIQGPESGFAVRVYVAKLGGRWVIAR